MNAVLLLSEAQQGQTEKVGASETRLTVLILEAASAGYKSSEARIPLAVQAYSKRLMAYYSIFFSYTLMSASAFKVAMTALNCVSPKALAGGLGSVISPASARMPKMANKA